MQAAGNRSRKDLSFFRQRESCPVCGGTYRKTLRHHSFTDPRVSTFLESYYHGRIPDEVLSEGVYELVECGSCRLIYQTEVLQDEWLAKLYEEWINPEESLRKRTEATPTYYAQIANEVAGIASFHTGRPGDVRVLDFGMGWGYWVRMARAFGYQASGYELSASRTCFARDLGLPVIQDLEAIPDSSIDYIYANQVFEHVAEPVTELRKLSRILSPRGIIDIHVPNQNGLRRYLHDKNWVARHDAAHPLEHINAFNRNTLRKLARACRLRPVMPPAPSHRAPGSIGLREVGVFLYNLSLSTHMYFRRQSDA